MEGSLGRFVLFASPVGSDLEVVTDLLRENRWFKIDQDELPSWIRLRSCAAAITNGHDVFLNQAGSNQQGRVCWTALAKVCEVNLIGISMERFSEHQPTSPSKANQAVHLEPNLDYVPLEDAQVGNTAETSDVLDTSSKGVEAITTEEGFDTIVRPKTPEDLMEAITSLGQGRDPQLVLGKRPRTRWDRDAPGLLHTEPESQYAISALQGRGFGHTQYRQWQIPQALLEMRRAEPEQSVSRDLPRRPSRSTMETRASKRLKALGKANSSLGSAVGFVQLPNTPYDQILESGNLNDTRPILLFDLNGTLTSHTSQRHSSGITYIRPGICELRRLQHKFRLGIYSSASQHTVLGALETLEAAAAPGPSLFAEPSLILHRGHTRIQEAPVAHIEGGGNAWDTVKPLSQYFKDLRRVLLIDDDAYKACPGEEENFVLMPSWDGAAKDEGLGILVNALVKKLAALDDDADLRKHSRQISEKTLADYERFQSMYAPQLPASDDPNVMELGAEPAAAM